MAIKKLTLNEEHIKLIKALQMREFSFSEALSTIKLDEAIEEIEINKEAIEALEKKHGANDQKVTEHMAPFMLCLEYLRNAKEKIQQINYEKSHYAFGIDQYSLWGGNYVLEDISRIIGCYDSVIPGTENLPTGPEFPIEMEQHMYELYDFIHDNLDYILSLVLQFSTEGGITAGTYKCINYEKIWTKVETKES